MKFNSRYEQIPHPSKKGNVWPIQYATVLAHVSVKVRISSGHYFDVAAATAKHTLLTFMAVPATLNALYLCIFYSQSCINEMERDAFQQNKFTYNWTPRKWVHQLIN